MLKLKSALSTLGKIHFHLLLADRSIPTDYSTLLLHKVRTCTLCLNKMLSFHFVVLDY